MNEIEKMYENAGIKKKYCGWLDMGDLDCQMQYIICESLKEWEELVFSSRFGKTEEEPELKYPPFTAEKVLKVLVFFLNRGVRLDFSVEEHTEISVENFKECIAHMVVRYWQDLTSEEKQQVKGILE